jgi:hypothetical protein
MAPVWKAEPQAAMSTPLSDLENSPYMRNNPYAYYYYYCLHHGKQSVSEEMYEDRPHSFARKEP